MAKTLERPTIHTSAFTRDITTVVTRVLKAKGMKSVMGLAQNPQFCVALFKEINDRVDWEEVTNRLDE